MSHAPPPLMMLREIRSWRDIKVDSDIGDDVDEDACVNFVSKLGCLLTTFGRGVPFGRVSNLGGCQTNSAGCHTPQNRTDCDIFNFLPIISHNNNLTTPSSSLAMYGNRHFGCSLHFNPSKMVITMPSSRKCIHARVPYICVFCREYACLVLRALGPYIPPAPWPAFRNRLEGEGDPSSPAIGAGLQEHEQLIVSDVLVCVGT